MTTVGRAARAMHVACISLLAVACSGPVPTGSPEPSVEPTEFAVASPTALPTFTAAPTSTLEPSPSLPIATPVVGPTFEPDPTPQGASAARTGVEVNGDVVDRPGVPDDLRDLYWWTFRGGDVGLLGNTAQLGVPPAEEILDARDGLVVVRRGTPSPSQGTKLWVRDFTTGSVLRKIETGIVALNAVLVGRRLFWTGMAAGSGCPGDQIDGGIWTMDVDAGGESQAIVQPGKAVTGCFVGRRLIVSPSRHTLGGLMGGCSTDNWMDVIDVGTLARLRRIRDVWPDAITDDSFIQWDYRACDAVAPGLGGITAYDLATADPRWNFPGATDVERFTPWRLVSLGSQFFVEYFMVTSSETRLFLATFDQLTGERRLLLRQVDTREEYDLWFIQPDQSTSAHVLLSTTAYLYAEPWEGRRRSVAIVDVGTATFHPDAFTIDPPFLCFDDLCLRD